MSENKPLLVVVAGPTAIGKTRTAISLAQKLDTEILSADSRQVYKELEIGVGRPSATELQTVRHHLIANVSIHQHYHAVDFEKDALQILEELFQVKKIAIVCGGTGLYIKTLCDGMDDMPEIDMVIRENLNQKFENEGISFLQEFIEKNDPDLLGHIDMMNHKRLIRATEIMMQTRQTYSSFRKKKNVERSFTTLLFCLYDEREIIRENIAKRVGEMFDNGWLEECENLFEYRHLKALQTVGYKEIFDYLDEKESLDKTKELIVTHTYQYAKRQLTWFKKGKRYIWVKRVAEIEQYLTEHVQNFIS
ncbi:MAG: tRNA (adenosine(37)-N6)-dimethylallyltransferase MiaA [Chitinophagales bacterium]|nr:tRNA (adenosine(37)-N6)-dimethylallyltransferase MiaA [Chitinophagales bacterium]